MPLRVLIAAAFYIVIAPLICAQSSSSASPAPAARPLAFEVASIRPHDGPLHTIMGYTASGPRLRLEGDNLRALIMEAYNLRNFQISIVGIDEQQNTYYDIVANAPEGTTPTRDDFRRMLQALLADRFQLRVHFEKKDMPVYALIVAKGGAKLTMANTDEPHSPDFHGVNGRNQFLRTDDITMPDLANDIWGGFISDRPVIDLTGLTGTYKLRIEATPEWRLRNGSEPGDIDIFTAVKEQLGLKLEPSTAPLDVLVVDSVQKPSEN